MNKKLLILHKFFLTFVHFIQGVSFLFISQKKNEKQTIEIRSFEFSYMKYKLHNLAHFLHEILNIVYSIILI